MIAVWNTFMYVTFTTTNNNNNNNQIYIVPYSCNFRGSEANSVFQFTL